MHDANRHVRGLRLSLAQDKPPLGLLLGAGCPAGVAGPDGQPLIPAIRGMTDSLRERVENDDQAEAFAALLAVLDEDGKPEPNVEDWLSTVRSLRAVAGGAPVRGLSKEQLDGLEATITGGIVGLVDRELPAAATPFHAVAAWTNATQRDLPVELFTTNYDLLLEQAFETMRSPYFDGFVGVRRPFFDNASIPTGTDRAIPPRFTRLWKLHGSINWFLAVDGEVIRSERADGSRRLIHPSHLKYDESRQMPYLALLDRLRAYLSQRGALLVTCGYSYRDAHINSVVGEALNANPTSSLMALMRGDLEQYREAAALAARHPNIALSCRNRAVIGTREGPWQSEEEKPVVGVQRCGTGEDLRVEVTLGEFAQLDE